MFLPTTMKKENEMNEKYDPEKPAKAEILQAKTECPWCRTIHARHMNTLCPFTIAERQLEACNALLDQLLLMIPGDDIDIIGSLQEALDRKPQGVTVQ